MIHITERHRSKHQNTEQNSSWLEINENEISDLYVNKKLSCRKIAELYKTDNCTIRRHLMNNGIMLRNFKKQVSLGVHQNYYKYCGKNSSSYKHGKYSGRKYNMREYINNAKQNKKWICNSWQILRDLLRFENVVTFSNMCKTVPKDNKLCVHHIDRNHQNNSIENLMVLCNACHLTIHRNISIKKLLYGRVCL